jgi:hypothetical protein
MLYRAFVVNAGEKVIETSGFHDGPPERSCAVELTMSSAARCRTSKQFKNWADTRIAGRLGEVLISRLFDRQWILEAGGARRQDLQLSCIIWLS